MPNEKLNSLARQIKDALAIRLGTTVGVAYDANSDVYLTAAGSIILFQTSPRVSGKYDGIGLTQKVYSPHVVKLGAFIGAKATGTVTGATVIATNTIDIAGDTYTAVAAAPVIANGEFLVGGSDAETMANLAVTINTVSTLVTAVVDGTTPEQLNITAINYGTGGNALGLVDGGGGTFTVSGATLSGGLDATVTPENLFVLMGTIARAGTVIKLVSKSGLAVADLVDDTYVVADFRNPESEISGNV